MNASTDTFATFVDVLAGVLDDHDTTGIDLAARLHLSRFHFDRVISSVAGEPPARFRRRILLERSAYRLVTTHQPIIDIAVEAGYASQAAFTRAFAKAFGFAPHQWRTRPTRTQLAARRVRFISIPRGVFDYPPEQRLLAWIC